MLAYSTNEVKRNSAITLTNLTAVVGWNTRLQDKSPSGIKIRGGSMNVCNTIWSRAVLPGA